MAKRWNRVVNGWLYLETSLHLLGNEELRIENCIRILEYNDVLVRVQTRDMTIEIWGNRLRVYDYNDASVIIKGSISSLSLTEKRGTR